MIDAKHLRLNNRVLNRNGFEMYVVGIYEKEVLLNFEYNEGDVWEESCKDLKGIPLTEELLLKFGFEKIKGKVDIFEKGRLRIWLGSRGQCLCYWIEEDTTTGHYISSIEHVHQLMNIHHALTGEELTMK